MTKKKSKTTISDAFELKSSTNGLSDDDASLDLMMFTCTNRQHSHSRDGYDYHVHPIGEYDDLDFKGHDVIINGRVRRCSDFNITDDGITIFVSSLSEVSK